MFNVVCDNSNKELQLRQRHIADKQRSIQPSTVYFFYVLKNIKLTIDNKYHVHYIMCTEGKDNEMTKKIKDVIEPIISVSLPSLLLVYAIMYAFGFIK